MTSGGLFASIARKVMTLGSTLVLGSPRGGIATAARCSTQPLQGAQQMMHTAVCSPSLLPRSSLASTVRTGVRQAPAPSASSASSSPLAGWPNVPLHLQRKVLAWSRSPGAEEAVAPPLSPPAAAAAAAPLASSSPAAAAAVSSNDDVAVGVSSSSTAFSLNTGTSSSSSSTSAVLEEAAEAASTSSTAVAAQQNGNGGMSTTAAPAPEAVVVDAQAADAAAAAAASSNGNGVLPVGTAAPADVDSAVEAAGGADVSAASSAGVEAAVASPVQQEAPAAADAPSPATTPADVVVVASPAEAEEAAAAESLAVEAAAAADAEAGVAASSSSSSGSDASSSASSSGGDAPSSSSEGAAAGGSNGVGAGPAIRLLLSSGAAMLPHPDKAARGGEDSFFIADHQAAVGVADGVGGWAEIGVDAGAYARLLMVHAKEAADAAADDVATGTLSAQAILESAFYRTNVQGSSTACVLVVNGTTLSASNLGDSGFVLVRDGVATFQCPQQQHNFNFPFQLGSADSMSDQPQAAMRFELQLQPGDIIVTGSDGLWDNIFAEEAATIASKCKDKGETATTAAQVLCRYARMRASDAKYHSPFSYAAIQAGYVFLGGKMDDITVIVSYVGLPSQL